MYDPMIVYTGKYKEFIDSLSNTRNISEKVENSDRHHVIPMCCGGIDNDEYNMRVYLTYKEHFIAHQILWKENPANDRLFYAYWRMCNGRVNIATPEEYEEARMKFISIQAGSTLSEETRRKISISHRRENLSEESLKRMSIAQSGENNPWYGKELPLEMRSKISNTMKGKGNFTGHTHTEETRRKIAIAHTNPSEETRRKRSESQRGKKRPPMKFKLICRSCGSSFLGNSPTQRYCTDCKDSIVSLHNYK